MSNDAFERLAQFVEEDMNFATSHYNDSYLERRFASRMRRTDCEGYDEYLELLQESDAEREELLDALSINVTGFFRNPDVWDGIASLLRELVEEQRRVKVWSAACADGREPYSILLLAHDDRRIDESAISVLATDINDETLKQAREGRYESSRTVDIDEQLEYLSDYRKYVERVGDEFHIDDRLREQVTFEHHDLINDRPKSGFDLVTCRNLFIYIDNEYKEPVLRTVAESLRSGGYLVIGKAETIPPQLQSEFSTVDGRLRIYQRE